MSDVLQLIGLNDSPFVRRVGVTLELYGLPYRKTDWSVYRNVDQLKTVNPMNTAPTVVLDDGTMLIESHAIIDWLDRQVSPERRLMPAGGVERRDCQQIIAVADVACEKVGQLYRERDWRPRELWYAVAIERFGSQIAVACSELEKRLAGEWFVGGRMTQADLAGAITLRFVRYYARELDFALPALPRLESLGARLEALPAFKAFDYV